MTSVVDDFTDSVLGFEVFGSNAAKDAAQTQQNAANEGIKIQREIQENVRGDLQPFREAGTQATNQLLNLINNPQNITDNDTFKTLMGEATRNITARNAARGKLNSGDTLTDLTNASFGIGNSVIGDQFNRLYNVAAMGQNAAAQTGTAAQNTGNAISNLLAQGANAKSAGLMAPSIANQNLLNQGLNAAALAFSDARLKHKLKLVGEYAGVPKYEFEYLFEPGHKYIGVMAQDVEKVHPQAVKTVMGFKAVDYEELRHAA